MKRLKKFFVLAVALGILAVSLVGCSEPVKPQMLQYNEDGTVILPEEGEEVAVITVKDYGTITIRFFPEEAPKAVDNFITLAKQGYYDNLTVHRIIKDFMIQSGDPRGDGTGGRSADGGQFEDEFSANLYNYVGAVSMANAGLNTNGSQFFINEGSSSEINDELFDSIIDYNKNQRGYGREYFDQSVKDLYAKVGGNPLLDGAHTVFGQVIDGMDVVHAIASVETSGGNEGKPLEQVIVESIQIVPYSAS